MRTIEGWVNDEACAWHFPHTVKFLFFDKVTHVSYVIVANRVISSKTIGYTMKWSSSSSSPLQIVINNEITDVIKCSIDNDIWTSDRTREQLLRTINKKVSSVPNSLADVCSMSTIRQMFGECWYIAVVVLVSKTLYNRLKSPTKEFLDFYRQSVNPVSSLGASLLVPLDVANTYRSIILENEGEDGTGIMNMHDGGWHIHFLLAIMATNDISYFHHTISDLMFVTKLTHLLKPFKNINLA